MCLQTRRYITKSHLIATDRFQPGYITVNCGKCAECLQTRKNDYFIRSYYEARQCINQGGFVLFDTLTYSDRYLPTIRSVLNEDRKNIHWDFGYVPDELNFPCFNARHVQLFLKRLRKRYVAGSVRFFLAGEYGSEDEYVDEHGNVRVGTARPHYHVLFFVTADVDPLEFSRSVSDEWIYGRTDGVVYKGVTYVRKKRLFRCDPKNYHFNNMINYFQKYTLKNGDFQEQIDHRIYLLVKDDVDEVERYYHVLSKDAIASYDSDESSQRILHSYDHTVFYHFPKKKYRAARRLCSQFIRSSQFYGASALDDPSFVQYMDDTGNVKIQRKDNAVVRLRLPGYYYRKRYYETYINRYGKRAWRLSQAGIDHVARLWFNRYECKKYSLRVLCAMANVPCDDGLLARLVDYVLVYRGAVGRHLYRSTAYNDYLSRYTVDRSGNVIYNHNTYSAACEFGKRFVSGHDCGVAGSWIRDGSFEMVSPTAWFDSNCYFDDDLEKILVAIGYVKERFDRHKQDVYDKKNWLESLHK